MIDGTAGPARIVFETANRRRRSAEVAGIVDAATVRVSCRPFSSRTRLRITVRTQMWDLTSDSLDTAFDGPVA
jgi:hypothetical protein